MPSAIDESCIIKLNSDYPIDSIEHHLKYAFEFNNNIGCNIDTSLTSIESSTPNLGIVSKEVSIPLNKRGIEPRLKRMVKRKLLNRSKRPPIDGWRLNDEEFDELNKTYRFTLERCCDLLDFNGQKIYPFIRIIILYWIAMSPNNRCIYNPPWSLVIKCVEHLRAGRSKSPLDTNAVIVLPDWPKFKAYTKKLK